MWALNCKAHCKKLFLTALVWIFVTLATAFGVETLLTTLLNLCFESWTANSANVGQTTIMMII